MGTGACSKVEKFDKSSQVPIVIEEPTTLTPKDYIYSRTPPVSTKLTEPFCRRVVRNSSKTPPLINESQFDLSNNVEDYAAIWDNEAKLSSAFQKLLKSTATILDIHQKETYNKKWNEKSSATLDSAHAKSTIDTQTHFCINFSPSEKIDELYANLQKIHAESDETIKRRTEQISTETESVLSQIRIETQKKQQHLLEYAKIRQIKQEEHYQQLLQEYINKLNEIKAHELNELQKQLEIYREEIIQESQLKIITVNEQASIVKTKIVQEEQHRATQKIDSIIAQMRTISADPKLEQLGAEIRTSTHVITSADFGTKAPGQSCSFELDENNPIQNDLVKLSGKPKKSTIIQ